MYISGRFQLNAVMIMMAFIGWTDSFKSQDSIFEGVDKIVYLKTAT